MLHENNLSSYLVCARVTLALFRTAYASDYKVKLPLMCDYSLFHALVKCHVSIICFMVREALLDNAR